MTVSIGMLFAAALLGGAMNAVAGGGSFVTFPGLVFSGLAPIPANATSTVALWPGSLAAAAAYLGALARHRRNLLILGAIGVVGGAIGALLLLVTSQSLFLQLVPFLLLLATGLFAFSGRITQLLHARIAASAPSHRDGLPRRLPLGLLALQLVIAIYGGYFGGGIGIMMLSALALGGMTDLRLMNALKNLLATCINGVAVLTFVVAGAVAWPQAVVMIGGALVGGFGGGLLAGKLDPRILRAAVIVIGLVMTAHFFLKA